ncbi:major facilitator superfamily domain-containing protein [Scleroderma yunnanense]
MFSVKGAERDGQGFLSPPRIATLLGSILVALCSGTGYIYSAYAPQLGARLHISHTKVNVVGLAANVGGHVSSPLLGCFVDAKGPRIPLIGAFLCSFIGYAGIQRIYDNGIGSHTSISPVSFGILATCLLFTGLGATAGATAAINTTAKSFPKSARATTTGLVLSGYGLSAFVFSVIAHTFFPGDTSALLRLLAFGTSIPMLVAYFVVRPVPLPSTCTSPMINGNEGYEPLPTGDIIPLTPGSEMMIPAGESGVHIPEDQLEHGVHHSSEPSHAIEMDWVKDQSRSRTDGLPDIHGIQLFRSPDFYLIVVIISLLSGTGIMYINNVGSIVLALYAQSNPEYDHLEASKRQAAQVSTLSVGNFAGRIVMGLTSDFMRTHLRISRAYCMCIVSSLFIISQVLAMNLSDVNTLWIATVLLGFAYGGLFGQMPAIMIEWFGLAHFSENSGWTSIAPLVGGNVFSIMLGRDLDAHTPTQVSDTSQKVRHTLVAAHGLIPRGMPSEHQCIVGQECYISSLRVTLVACIVALGLSTWAGIRDGRRNKAEWGSHT